MREDSKACIVFLRCSAVRKISLIPRSMDSLECILQMPIEGRYFVPRSRLESRLNAVPGGRAAELLNFGAADDMNRASAVRATW
ncbi:hypothetical protein [Nevskia soli]|uniref:hypothetical protein n=1 Tax=Nevskia soli TaxID=418856 RepID=UPI0004A6F0AA|nr:hypothetical protein [Nevskia soli]